MKTEHNPSVAVLLATYNGAQHINAQIQSLAGNAVSFTLHWLDDHSSDNTRDMVRSSAQASGIGLAEYHQSKHLGLPGSYFRLLESVEADIYLFCDQDDIWSPGKIDSTVSNLAPDIASPVLCFSDSMLFVEDEPERSCSVFDTVGRSKVRRALRDEPMFEMFSRAIAPAHTQGFSKPVRDMFLKHKNIAYAHAFMHDWWMHDITIAVGTVRVFSEMPTVMWRQHTGSFCGNIGGPGRGSLKEASRYLQFWRAAMARHARGFVLLGPDLPCGVNRDRLISLAKIIGTIDQRQTIASVFRLVRQGAVPQSLKFATLFALSCLCSDAQLSADACERDLSSAG